MRSATSTIAASSIARLVSAGVPSRTPDATKGGFSSKGMVFLLTVIPADSKAPSATLPVSPTVVTSTKNT